MELSKHPKSLPAWPHDILFILIVVAFLVVLVSILYARPPRRRITIRKLPSIPLVERIESIEVRTAGVPIASPYLTQITMANTGRRDISPADFDISEPLSVGLGVLIASAAIESSFESDLPLSVRDRVLDIGPGLFGRGAQLVIRVVTDGPIDDIGIKSPLANTRLELEYGAEIILYRGTREKKRVSSNQETEKRAKLTKLSEISVILGLVVAILAWLFPRK